MNITIEIKDSDRLIAALETLAGAIIANTSKLTTPPAPAVDPGAAAPAPVTTEDKPKRGRPPKEKAEAAPAPTPEPVAETPQAEEDPFGAEEAPAAATPVYTLDDVRTAGLAFRDKHGQDKAKALIKAIGGVDKLADMPESKWAEFIAATKSTPSGETDL